MRYKYLMGPELRTESRRWGGRCRFFVRPNCMGLLYRKNRFETVLEPGIYDYWDWGKTLELFLLPRTPQSFMVHNQEVLTQDNIALRFSYTIEYQIQDGQRLLTYIDPNQAEEIKDYRSTLDRVASLTEKILYPLTQIYWRQVINTVNSLDINNRRDSLMPSVPEGLQTQVAQYGMVINGMQLRDISFPKAIQELFSRQLEAKIRSQTDLENARTTVATARALKNAAQLMGQDSNIKFLQYLETLTKIAASGKHTFVIGQEPSSD